MPQKRIYHVMVIALLFATAGCGNPTVAGRINDAFGKPLEDALITIESTSFSTTSDADGNYEIEFLPGQFKIKIKKDGYTSATLDFNVAEARDVPAAEVTLYPIPTEQGLYYIGADELIPLDTNQLHRETVRVSPWLPSSTRYYFAQEHPILPEGDARFIDTHGGELRLVRASGRSGLFLDTGREGRSGLVEGVTSEKVGDEALTIWRLSPLPGSYGWVRFERNILGGYFPAEEYFGFQIGNAPWFDFVGTFASDNYAVDLWKDPAEGLVGHVTYPVLEADSPVGAIREVSYEVSSGELRFRARVAGLGVVFVTEGGEEGWRDAPDEVHEFEGKFNSDQMIGIFRRMTLEGGLLDSRPVTLEKQPRSDRKARYDDLATWEEEYSKPVLGFRGPQPEA